MSGRKAASTASRGRPKRTVASNFDLDFVYEKEQPSQMGLKSPVIAHELDLLKSEADVRNLISMLETRISQLEFEGTKTVKVKSPVAKIGPAGAPPAISMNDIRHTASPAAALPSSLAQPTVGLTEISPLTALFPYISEKGVQELHTQEGRPLKSGYELKTQFTVKKEIRWPHAHLGPIQHMCSIKPENLDILAFFYGYFMILGLDLIPQSELKGRIEHGKQILSHAMVHGWKSARRYHYTCLWAMEHENLHWEDKAQLLLLSLSAANEKNMGASNIAEVVSHGTSYHAAQQSSIGNTPARDDRKKSILCYSYNLNADGCRYEQSPTGCKKLHACAKCAEKGLFVRHPARDCKQ